MRETAGAAIAAAAVPKNTRRDRFITFPWRFPLPPVGDPRVAEFRYGSFCQHSEVTQMPRFSHPGEPGPGPAPPSYPRARAKPLFPAGADRYGRARNAEIPRP